MLLPPDGGVNKEQLECREANGGSIPRKFVSARKFAGGVKRTRFPCFADFLRRIAGHPAQVAIRDRKVVTGGGKVAS
jgi:hypothetical protein